MKCTSIQRRLLALTEPAGPPPGIEAHLRECSECREIQRRLVQVDRHVGLLPAAPSSGPGALLAKFRAEVTPWDRLRAKVGNMHRWQLGLTGLAAGLLLFILAWKLMPTGGEVVTHRPPKNSPPDAFVAGLVGRAVKLAGAETPQVQVIVLADLAEDLRSHTKPLLRFSNDKDSLADLADWYGRVVQTGVNRACKLPKDQRTNVLTAIARELDLAYQETEQLRKDAKITSSDHPLQKIANAALNSKLDLESLLSENRATLLPASRRVVQRSTATLPNREESILEHWPMLSVAVPLAAVSHAHAQPPTPTGGDLARSFQRNRSVIRTLVAGSLRIAEQDDLVYRAAACSALADNLAEEIQEAATDRDTGRALELARHVSDLLKLGVGFNLTTASINIPIGATREGELREIGTSVKEFTRRLEVQLRNTQDRDTQEQLQRVVMLVNDGRAEVEKALRGRGAY